ncbi:MAG TPA: 2-C-methyl-D-erythritol 2,4-cyclodiphosphate synthase [Fimbriimonadaceae bacterium]|nr:2-C-methyl-D-erythritol 2,4-cyclodiphosphate synthase [Fimbriimonadaceae bacterium]
MRIVAAVLAAGRSERFGEDKLGVLLGGKGVWRWSFDALASHPRVDAVGLVVSAQKAHWDVPEAAFLIEGGSNRQESSRRAVEAAEGDIVLLQDAARPFTSQSVITRVIEGVERCGAAAPAAAVPDTIRMRSGDGYALLDRTRLAAMQTPQGGRREVLLEAHRRAGVVHTDEMGLVEAIGHPYEIVEGDPSNFKITTPADLARARAIVESVEIRTGIGYDIHRFSSEPGRRLFLGGVEFAGHAGLDGHSDADVVIHAAVDALLGAAGLGDIGQHFPNTDPRWRAEPSATFLRHAAGLLADRGWSVSSLDITMIGESPKVMPRAGEIRAALSACLGIEADRVSFKATTNEGLGSIGRGEGIAAYAVATLRR